MSNIDQIKNDLDKQISSESANVGIGFGTELFKEFKDRGWFTLETFGLLGTSLFSEQVPAYNKTHFVFQSWGIPDNEFRIGKSQ